MNHRDAENTEKAMTGQSVFLPESVREGLHTDSGRNTDSRRGQVLPQELAQGLNLALVQGQIAFGGIAVERFAVGGGQVHRGEDASGIAIERGVGHQPVCGRRALAVRMRRVLRLSVFNQSFLGRSCLRSDCAIRENRDAG